MNEKPYNLVKLLAILVSIQLILCGCGGSSYEASSEPRDNVSPQAVADQFTVDEDNSIDLTPQILSNDSDVDGDNLTPRILTQASNGRVYFVNDILRYTPDNNFHGIDTFFYEVSDGYGGMSSAPISITVSAVNDLPIVKADAVEIDEDASIVLSVLANDIDIDGDSLSIFSVSTAVNGSIVHMPGSTTILLTPLLDSLSSVTFSYIASDGNGGFSTGNVNVYVNPVNDPPVANNDFGSTSMNVSTEVNVLLNDTDVDDQSLLRVVETRNVTGGTAVPSPAATSVLVTPYTSSIIPINFDYVIEDEEGAQSTASVTVSITCDEYTTQGIEFVCIKAGTFDMGSLSSEIGRKSDEGPVTQVTITNDFYLSKYEITKGDWDRLGASWPNLSLRSQIPTSSHPVVHISWDHITELGGFLDNINSMVNCDTSSLSSDESRYDPSNIPPGCFRLATEAEWEHAARAGSNTRYSFGDDETQLNLYALYDPDTNDLDNAGSANRVGEFLPNDNGLYDMHGNVREWVYDRYAASYAGGSLIDPTGPVSGARRVLRGGSWYVSRDNLRSASREGHDTYHIGSTTGFRLLLVR